MFIKDWRDKEICRCIIWEISSKDIEKCWISRILGIIENVWSSRLKDLR